MNVASDRRGFTLIELLVSMVIVVLLTLILVSIVNSAASTWRYTSGKIEQFRGATNAFEAMTRRLSQATLNTSWDYHYPGTPPDPTKPPDSYTRHSDLRFLADKTETAVGSSSPHRPTYGVFFQAPLGYVDDPTNFGDLSTLLNTWGYYIEFNTDSPPAFITQMPKPPKSRYRYRMMELMQPSNSLTIYSETSGNSNYIGHQWFTTPLTPLGAASAPVHILAENVIALVILPKLSKEDDTTGTKLAPQYSYDSAPTGITPTDPTVNPQNQLPPVVQVTLVAIDEVSANRIDQGSNVPGFDSLLGTLFVDATKYDADLAQLQTALISANINFRVFTSNVSLRGAKWSKN